MRAVVGVGLLTTHKVDVTTDAEEGDADVEVRLGDGDITVPRFSARQQMPGGPLMGDPIHIQERCDVQHMDQLKDKVVQLAYTQYLLFGRTPRKLPEPECDLSGDVIEFSKDLEIPPPVLDEGFAAADAALTLGQAQWEGKADVIDLPGGTQVVTNDAAPVALEVDAEGLTMTVTDIERDRPRAARDLRAADRRPRRQAGRRRRSRGERRRQAGGADARHRRQRRARSRRRTRSWSRRRRPTRRCSPRRSAAAA